MTPLHLPHADSPRVAFVRIAPWTGLRVTHPHDLMWPISMLYTASLARAQGMDTRLWDLHVEQVPSEVLTQEIAAWRPDFLILDTTTTTLDLARRLAAGLSQHLPGLTVLAVGQHASAMPGTFLEDPTFAGCLRGEYETALIPLLEGATTGGIFPPEHADGSRCAAELPIHLADLERLPPLDPQGIWLSRYRLRSMHVRSIRRQRWGFLLTSRGCPYNCIFCSPTLRQSHGRAFRAMPAEAVVEDLDRLSSTHQLTAFYFVDDLFTYDRPRVLTLCESIRRLRRRLHFFIQTRADLLDPEMLSELRAAGCEGVKIGVESGSDRILTILRKGATAQAILRGAQTVRRAGLSLTACYMLGNPSETREEMRQTYRLARAIDADMVQVAFHAPYPGSESFRRYGHQVANAASLSHYDGDPLPLSALSPSDLLWEQRLFYARYYGSPRGLWSYLSRRAPYRITDPDEWKLWWEAVRFWKSPTHRSPL